MLAQYSNHNIFKENVTVFCENDPHLRALAQLKYQYSPHWWKDLSFTHGGIYILTGGRQVGKSTSCKLLMKHCLKTKKFSPNDIFYLPCDEIYDAKELSTILRFFLESTNNKPFLLIIDEITYVPHWDRVIKALADEGFFTRGICLLTGSDTLILKEAAMRFPGRRGSAAKTDFHLYPLTFAEYVELIKPTKKTNETLAALFQNFLISGGYLRAINDVAQYGEVTPATFITYEQWIRGDFLKQGKNEEYLLAIFKALMTIGVSTISFSSLTQKIGLMSKETCIDYLRLLERMDILFDLQSFDLNKKQGSPKKDRKFHFLDPFIQRTIYQWLQREGYLNSIDLEPTLVESTVASHCFRLAKTFYFKAQGEIDIIWLKEKIIQAIEVKWSNQLRPNDLKTLKQFKNSLILGKNPETGTIENIKVMPVYHFLFHLHDLHT
jgi:predicted AAA+ superfamily ATPase